MNKLFFTALLLVVTGCGSALSRAERAELAKLRSADRAARLARAEKDGYQPPGSPQLPATAPQPPVVAGGGGDSAEFSGGQPSRGATTSEVVRGERSAYLCVIGNDPRQVRKGRLLKLVNNYCDGRRDGGLNCADNDYDGYADFDSFVAFEIDGKPVATDTQGVLKPLSTCYVDVGRARRVRLTVMRHANIGTHRVPRVDPNTVDATYHSVLSVDGNVTLHDVTENRPWSSR